MSISRVVPEAISGVISDGILLVRQEVRLAKAEAEEKISQAQSGLISIMASMIIGLAALLILAQAVVIGLNEFLSPLQATLAVGLTLAVVAVLVLLIGRRNLSPSNLTPRRTINSVREGTETLTKGLDR